MRTNNKQNAQVSASLTSFIKANASHIPAAGWNIALNFYMRCDADPVALDKALDGLFFVVDGALTQVSLCDLNYSI